MWHKSQEIDYETELNNDQDYHIWSEQLRDESERGQIGPNTGILDDFSPNATKDTPNPKKR